MSSPRGRRARTGAAAAAVALAADPFTRCKTLVLRAINAALEPVQVEVATLVSYASSVALWTAKFYALLAALCVWVACVACSSLFTYLLFYHYLIPQYQASLPMHFDVSYSSSGGGGFGGQGQGGTGGDLALQSPHLLHAHPHAIVSLQNERQWRVAEGGVATTQLDAQIKSPHRYLTPGHSYNAYLDLSFPDSPANHALGMQTLEMHLLTSSGQLLATSLASFTPRYTSPLVRWMYSWAFAIPLVTGVLREEQCVTLNLLEGFPEQEAHPTADIRVFIKSASGAGAAAGGSMEQQQQQGKFQVYSSTLRLQVQLTGLRWAMYHWTLTTGLVGWMVIFWTQLFWSGVAIIGLALWCMGVARGGAQQEEEEAAAAAAEEEAEADKLVAQARQEVEGRRAAQERRRVMQQHSQHPRQARLSHSTATTASRSMAAAASRSVLGVPLKSEFSTADGAAPHSSYAYASPSAPAYPALDGSEMEEAPLRDLTHAATADAADDEEDFNLADFVDHNITDMVDNICTKIEEPGTMPQIEGSAMRHRQHVADAQEEGKTSRRSA